MPDNIAAMIDHTLLKADATKDQILKVCEEAKAYQFASVCINPTWVDRVAKELQGTSVAVCTVIGFPLGATTTKTKAFEAQDAIERGATEIDMVINIGSLIAGEYEKVKEDIAAVVQVAQNKALVKVIIETALLTDELKERACLIAVEAGADFVKTSTGFSTSGATVEDIRLMRKAVGPTIGVKASGGVRSLEDVKQMIAAGATRIGASSGVAIVQGLQGENDY